LRWRGQSNGARRGLRRRERRSSWHGRKAMPSCVSGHLLSSGSARSGGVAPSSFLYCWYMTSARAIQQPSVSCRLVHQRIPPLLWLQKIDDGHVALSPELDDGFQEIRCCRSVFFFFISRMLVPPFDQQLAHSVTVSTRVCARLVWGSVVYTSTGAVYSRIFNRLLQEI
jgi:hypothetical protein